MFTHLHVHSRSWVRCCQQLYSQESWGAMDKLSMLHPHSTILVNSFYCPCNKWSQIQRLSSIRTYSIIVLQLRSLNSISLGWSQTVDKGSCFWSFQESMKYLLLCLPSSMSASTIMLPALFQIYFYVLLSLWSHPQNTWTVPVNLPLTFLISLHV